MFFETCPATDNPYVISCPLPGNGQLMTRPVQIWHPVQIWRDRAPPVGTGSSAPRAGGTTCTASPEELRESSNGNNPFLLHVLFHSGLQIDVEGQRRPRTRRRFMISSGGGHSFWPLYYILYYIILYRWIELQDPPPELPECSRLEYFIERMIL